MTQATSVPILVFLGLSVLDLDPMYEIDRQTSDVHHRLMPLPRGGLEHNKSVAMGIDPRYDALCVSRLSWLVIIFAMLHQLNTWALCLMQVFLEV